jgi:alanyl-tRNA synthetase
VRAGGGKHNDLDNVGYTARHHTFFEMLGNFSFGDYFKEQAITHAWTLLTREWGLSPERLTVTVYHTDDEAFRSVEANRRAFPKTAIIRHRRPRTISGRWAPTGRAGPCSEIFFDHGDHIPGGPPGSPTRTATASSRSGTWCSCSICRRRTRSSPICPKPSIDTGMGLERIAAVMQGRARQLRHGHVQGR